MSSASVGKCAFPNCGKKAKDGYNLFQSPKDPVRSRCWAAYAGKQCEKQMYFYLCSDHFEKKWFSFCGEKPRLRPRAVPTIYPSLHGCIENLERLPISSFSEISTNRGQTEGMLSAGDSSGISGTVIHSATEKYIINYELNPSHVIDETPELYNFVTLPHLNEDPFNLQWVYDIINGTAEKDQVVFQTPSKDDKNGFLLIPDLKWDGVTLENLHLLALPYSPGILSLRNLGENHIPLLKNIYIEGKNAIKEKYGLVGSRLRIFLHYQPSFYHLHVHFTSISHEAFGIHVGKGHLLASVISSIEVCPNYYQEATLPFFLRESDSLFLKFERLGIVERLDIPPSEG